MKDAMMTVAASKEEEEEEMRKWEVLSITMRRSLMETKD